MTTFLLIIEMPSKGQFTLSVIDATSREILPERTGADGKVWVKGEDGKEFYLVVDTKQEPKGEDVLCCVKIDGISVGYRKAMRESGVSYVVGLRSGANIVSIKFVEGHALPCPK